MWPKGMDSRSVLISERVVSSVECLVNFRGNHSFFFLVRLLNISNNSHVMINMESAQSKRSLNILVETKAPLCGELKVFVLSVRQALFLVTKTHVES